MLIRWERLGEFVIGRSGRRITVYPSAGARAASLRDLVVTFVASFALLRRGIESLHASAVVRGGRAVAFLGGPGSGKSTLAAFLARRGARVLSDDLLAVEPLGQQLLAYPGLPELKLSPAAARALGLPAGRSSRVAADQRKRLWVPPRARGPHRLAALYFLRLVPPRNPVRLVELSAGAAFRALLGSAYNASLRTRRRLRRQFGLFARLARNVPAWRLHIPRGWHRLEEAAERIGRDLTGWER